MADDFQFKYAVHPYFDQLLKTATNGNVTVEYAIHVSRMRLTCNVCESQLTAPESDGTELDYGMQEFIKIHAHVGGHKDKPTGDMVQDGYGNLVPLGKKCTCSGVSKTGPYGTYGQAHHKWCPAYVYVKLVTADFKAIETVEEARIKRDIIRVALGPIPKQKSKVLKIATGRKFR